MNYKVSVIVPCYNSELTLEKCIASVMNQTLGFENIELILYDDYSKDSTKNIIKSYAKKFDNIVPIYSDVNSGAPSTGRNKGIELASSDYIMFLDNDDEYDKYLCETLYSTISQEDCDLVGCNNFLIDALNHPYKINTFDEKQDKTYIYHEDMFYYSNVYIWTKIFKKEIIIQNDIRFITEGIGEDTIFCFDYLLNSKLSIHLNNYYGYYHYINGDNLSTSNIKWVLDYFEMINVINDRFSDNLDNIDSNKFFQNRINSIILAMLSLKENDWSSLFTLINKLYNFEKKINYKNIYEKSIVNKFINKLIIENHLKLATFAVYILNRLYQNKFLLNIYRKFILNK